MSDLISRQAALDIINAELNGWLTDDERLHLEGVATAIECLPSAQPSIKDAISVIRQFLDDEGKFLTTCIFMTKDGIRLLTDWGYFEEGLNEIERYAERREDG